MHFRMGFCFLYYLSSSQRPLFFCDDTKTYCSLQTWLTPSPLRGLESSTSTRMNETGLRQPTTIWHFAPGTAPAVDRHAWVPPLRGAPLPSEVCRGCRVGRATPGEPYSHSPLHCFTSSCATVFSSLPTLTWIALREYILLLNYCKL